MHRLRENMSSDVDTSKDKTYMAEMAGIRTRADDPAIIFGEKRWTFLELDELSDTVAGGILAQLRARDRLSWRNSDGDAIIGVCMAPSDVMVITLLAILKIGAAYVPLDDSYPTTRIHHILGECQALLVISDTEMDIFKDYESVVYGDLLAAKETISADEEVQLQAEREEGRRLAVVLYTSGSTGLAKGVRLMHSSLINRMLWQWKEYPFPEDEVVSVFKTTFCFIDSLWELWAALPWGRTLVVLSKENTRNPETLIAALETYKIQRLMLVTTMIRSILLYMNMQNDPKTAVKRLQHLHLWMQSGEHLPASVARDFYKTFDISNHKLGSFYGCTETTGDCIVHVIQDVKELDLENTVAIGKPVDNVGVYILDKNLQPIEEGQVGELFVSGCSLAVGYVAGREPGRFLNNPYSSDPNHSRVYRTGDYSKIVNGVVFYLGRTDSQVKVRGHRVDLSEIEQAMSKVDGAQNPAVLCYHPGEEDQTLLVFYTTEQGIGERKVEEALAELLPIYMVPQAIKMDEIPLFNSDKVDRQKLFKYYEENLMSYQDSNVPLDYSGVGEEHLPAAKALFESVATVLGKSIRGDVNTSTNFYELGGNSLNTMIAIKALKDKGFTITVADFIGAETFAETMTKMYPEGVAVPEEQQGINREKFTVDPLMDEVKDEVKNLVVTSLYKKGDIDQYMEPPLEWEHYEELIDLDWPHVVASNLSFTVKDKTGDVVGVSFSVDADADAELPLKTHVVDFINFLKAALAEVPPGSMPTGPGKVVNAFMLCTHAKLNHQENVELMLAMEVESIEVAKRAGYIGIMACNTSPLTQQIAIDITGYTELVRFQANKYVAEDGSRPFSTAPDHLAVCVNYMALLDSTKGSALYAGALLFNSLPWRIKVLNTRKGHKRQLAKLAYPYSVKKFMERR